jgi:ribosomal protein L23
MQKLDDAANQINKRLKQKLTLAQLALENPQTYRMIVETEEQISEFNKLYCAKVALINTLNISPDMKKLQKRRLKDRKKKILTVIRKDLSESMGQAADEEIQAGSLESEILDYENDQTAEQ